MEHKDHINIIIGNTLEKLNSLYHREGSGLSSTRLIFPRYWKTQGEQRVEADLRVSEQELRFMFVEELNRYCDVHREWEVFYSVETPTSNSYKLSGDGLQSGCIDLCIHDKNLKRIALIEFKALNPSDHDHAKDAFKLRYEIEGELRYFIEIVKSHRSDTADNIVKKFSKTENFKKFKALDMSRPHKFQYIISSFKGDREEIISKGLL